MKHERSRTYIENLLDRAKYDIRYANQGLPNPVQFSEWEISRDHGTIDVALVLPYLDGDGREQQHVMIIL
jgi:hypothetical protein